MYCRSWCQWFYLCLLFVQDGQEGSSVGEGTVSKEQRVFWHLKPRCTDSLEGDEHLLRQFTAGRSLDEQFCCSFSSWKFFLGCRKHKKKNPYHQQVLSSSLLSLLSWSFGLLTEGQSYFGREDCNECREGRCSLHYKLCSKGCLSVFSVLRLSESFTTGFSIRCRSRNGTFVLIILSSSFNFLQWYIYSLQDGSIVSHTAKVLGSFYFLSPFLFSSFSLILTFVQWQQMVQSLKLRRS